MKKHTQDLDELKHSLTILDTDWKDDLAVKVLQKLKALNSVGLVDRSTLKELLAWDWDVGEIILRLFLEKSKDEFRTLLKGVFLQEKKFGKSLFRKDPEFFIQQLDSLGIIETMNAAMAKQYSWQDIIIERLKSGRGSAIKGQARGRSLENFVEGIIREVFNSYDARCNFQGNNAEAKADFVIPSKENPSIVIEVKAYGATGSKQTDSLGDIQKIIKSKRHDTHFLFVTDGITWLDRISDLRKVIEAQNQGYIYRIYTKKMSLDLLQDLKQIKIEKNL